MLVEALLAVAWAGAGYAVCRAYAGDRFGRWAPLAAAGACALAVCAALGIRHHVAPPPVAALASAADPPLDVDCTRMRAADKVAALGALDRLEDDEVGANQLADGAHVTASDRLTLSGWAADGRSRAPAQGACALVDGRVVRQTARYGAPRDDVAAALGRPLVRQSGYSVSFSAGALRAGAHEIRIGVLGSGGRYELLPLARHIVVDTVEGGTAPRP